MVPAYRAGCKEYFDIDEGDISSFVGGVAQVVVYDEMVE
jgi:hypothetical protein